MRKFSALAVVSLLALTGCAAPTVVESAPATESVLAVEQATAVQVKNIRQGDYLNKVKGMLSDANGLNDIQILAAGYEVCLSVNESNKDAYRERVMAEASSVEAGLDRLVIAAGAKGLLCP